MSPETESEKPTSRHITNDRDTESKIGQIGGVFRSALLSNILILGIIGIGWTNGDQNYRSWGTLGASILQMSGWVEDSGLTLIGIAISLLALSVTVVSIVGLQQDEISGFVRRRGLTNIASMLIELGMSISSAVASMSCIGFIHKITLSSINNQHGIFENGVSLSLMAASGLIIFLMTSSVYLKIDLIITSDSDAELRESTRVQARRAKLCERRNILAKIDGETYRSVTNESVTRTIQFAKKRQTRRSLLYATLTSAGAGLIIGLLRLSRSYNANEPLNTGTILPTALAAAFIVQIALSTLIFTLAHFVKSAEKSSRVIDFVSLMILLTPFAFGVLYAVYTGTRSSISDGRILWPIVNLILLIFPVVLSWTIPKCLSLMSLVDINCAFAADSRANQCDTFLDKLKKL